MIATVSELTNALRVLAMDAVQKAKSGHPGMPMGMADIAEVLWRDFLNHSPNHPHWWNRDRFVLSNGHGSMLLYALLYLSGYEVTIDDLKSFRQMHSKTPGHPEYGETPGVEATTGPLGQGLANGVGMAIAENLLSAQFNKPEYTLFDHYTYVFVGDGCLMEGISHEAASLAGVLALGKLIVLWDDNGISIDGKVKGWFADNTAKRFEAYGWQVIESINGHDREALHAALVNAKACLDKPTLICCRTQIAYGSPNLSGQAQSHGAPLGEEEIQATRRQLGWDAEPFIIPEKIKETWNAQKAGDQLVKQWDSLFAAYTEAYPTEAQALKRRMSKALPKHWEAVVDDYLGELIKSPQNISTRKASYLCLNRFAPKLPEIVGGSADLTGSNLTRFDVAENFSVKNRSGQYIAYGVREFGMSAVMNGIALHGGFIPYGGTFLVFSDYARNAIRLSAMMKQQVIYVLTHDSIGLGEDGPTHQPVEHLASLRMIPGLSLWRPADDIETSIAWQQAIENKTGPTVLALTRQSVPRLSRSEKAIAQIKRGAYIIKDCMGVPDLILIGTGSELQLALAVSERLAELSIRVVSIPSVDRFLSQSIDYQNTILPNRVRKRVVIEAAIGQDWYRFVGIDGKIFSMDSFGFSAPDKAVFDHFGFNESYLSEAIQAYYQKEEEK